MPTAQWRFVISAFAAASRLPTTFGTLHLAGGRAAIKNVRGTAAAGFQFAFPGWEAVIVQLPAPVMWTSAAATVQSPVAAKLTASPDDALALTLKSGSPSFRFGSAAKLIVWPALAIANARLTLGADAT